MLPLLLLLPLCLPQAGSIQSTEQASATIALDQLEQALISQNSAEIVRLLRSTAGLQNARVVASAREALMHPDLGVRGAAMEVLRYADTPETLEMLHGAFAEGQLLESNELLYAHLIKATSHHANIGSVRYLVRGGFRNDTKTVLRARILGLGNVPSKSALIALMNGLAALNEEQRLLHMDEFRLALVRQTNVDWGMDAQAWLSWWEKNRTKPRSPKAGLSAALKPEWNAYWKSSSLEPVLAQVASMKRSAPKPNKARRGKSEPKRTNPKSPTTESKSGKEKARPKQTPKPKVKAKPKAKAKAEPQGEAKGNAKPNKKGKPMKKDEGTPKPKQAEQKSGSISRN
jgi:hypothetical protein